MKHASIARHIALACPVFTLLAAGIALAQDADPSTIEVDADQPPISSDAAPESGPDLQQFTETNQQESATDVLHRNFESYKSAMTIGNYSEADTLAKQVVEISITLYGLDSHESAKSLSNLGLAQQKNKDYESAVMNFTAAINIVERIEDRLNRELVRPLQGLGTAQLASGRPDLAKAAFDRAIHISHVNDGPLNIMQIGTLEDLAEIHLSTGDVEKANDLHEYIYNLEARHTDLDSTDIIPALERQAEWLHRLHSLEKERVMWRKIIRILESSYGKNDLSLIDPLTGLGTSYLYRSDFQSETYTDGTMTSGDTYLKRAARIAAKNPDSSKAIQVQTKLALGDYYTLSLRARRAAKVYRETWEFLSTDDESMDVRNELFDQPELLQPIYPPKYFNSKHDENFERPPDSFELGTIVLGYNITDRGFSQDISIVAADPAGLQDMEYAVARAARRLIYRPRLEDGIAVATPDQSYVHEFYYRPSDVPEPEATGAAQSEALATVDGDAADHDAAPDPQQPLIQEDKDNNRPDATVAPEESRFGE